jgi:hypothetical protein
MECVAGDEQLHALAPAQVGADNDALGRAAAMQQQDLDRVAEIIVVELVVADAVEPHWRRRRYHEDESAMRREQSRKSSLFRCRRMSFRP